MVSVQNCSMNFRKSDEMVVLLVCETLIWFHLCVVVLVLSVLIAYCCVVVCGCEAAFVAEKSAAEAERHLSSVSFMWFNVYFIFL